MSVAGELLAPAPELIVVPGLVGVGQRRPARLVILQPPMVTAVLIELFDGRLQIERHVGVGSDQWHADARQTLPQQPRIQFESGAVRPTMNAGQVRKGRDSLQARRSNGEYRLPLAKHVDFHEMAFTVEDFLLLLQVTSATLTGGLVRGTDDFDYGHQLEFVVGIQDFDALLPKLDRTRLENDGNIRVRQSQRCLARVGQLFNTYVGNSILRFFDEDSLFNACNIARIETRLKLIGNHWNKARVESFP